MGLGATRDHRNDPRYSEFGALLYRPFETIELEDCKIKSERSERRGRQIFAKRERDAILCDRDDRSATDAISERDIELLADAGTQYARKMCGVVSDEGSSIARMFVGDPAAAGHGERVAEGIFATAKKRPHLFARKDGARVLTPRAEARDHR
jgi:hypothetical protein